MRYLLSFVLGIFLLAPSLAAAEDGVSRTADVLLEIGTLKSQALQNDADRLILEEGIDEGVATCLQELRAWPQAVSDATDAHARWMSAFEAQTSALLADHTPIDSWSALGAFQEKVVRLEEELPSSEPLRARYSAVTAQLVFFGNAAARAVATIETLLRNPPAHFQATPGLPPELRVAAETLRRSRDSAGHAHALLTAQLQTRSRLVGQLPSVWSRRLSAATARLQQVGSAQAEIDLQRRINDLLVFGRLQSRLVKHDLEVFMLHEALLSPLTALRLERQRSVELQDLDDELEVADLGPELEARLGLLVLGAHQAHKAALEALLAAQSERAIYRQRRVNEVATAPQRDGATTCQSLAGEVQDADGLASEEAYQEYVHTCVANS